jgi:hypothetical protein
MFHQPFQRFPGEIEAVEIGVTMLQLGDQPQRMSIVIEAADIFRHRIQRFFTGMAERRVAQIVGQRHRLGQILVSLKRAGQAARQLRHFQRMGQPGAVVIALMLHKDLRLVLETAKRRGVNDAVAVAAVAATGGAFGFGIKTAAALPWAGGVGGMRSRRTDNRA